MRFFGTEIIYAYREMCVHNFLLKCAVRVCFVLIWKKDDNHLHSHEYKVLYLHHE